MTASRTRAIGWKRWAWRKPTFKAIDDEVKAIVQDAADFAQT